MMTRRDPLSAGTPEEAMGRLMAQNARVEDARAKVRLESDRLDAMLADAVSAKPELPTWYAHPGVLTIDQAISVITGGPAALHRSLERYRKAQAEAAKARPRRRRR